MGPGATRAGSPQSFSERRRFRREYFLKVIVAEGDAVSRMILTRAVEGLGHEVLAANDGRAAWETFQTERGVDVIISDWMMLDMSGLELCSNVRAAKSAGYTFFIFLTALTDKEHLLEGMEAGADDYLSKPLDRNELRARLVAADRVTELHRRLEAQDRQLEKLNVELGEQARQDILTGLSNRLKMREDLEAAGVSRPALRTLLLRHPVRHRRVQALQRPLRASGG